ncbi:hypothetical protein RMSM_05220 [Rhodopirellula maiorica SM1]|uniref:Uncharacterized protein n=1 Tax=Rhodopirellula maiorica SM1 TaxID=1265738 RepID=M5RR60_9BACT|nr:hypothetical protein RMSM_05220 [Rhodopirellula maiorica SM1]
MLGKTTAIPPKRVPAWPAYEVPVVTVPQTLMNIHPQILAVFSA